MAAARLARRAAATETHAPRLPLLDFIPATTRRWRRPDHLAPIAALFERAVLGEPVRALVSVPPRHGKTETLLHGIPWWLLRHPEQTVAYVSYADRFARSKSRQARAYARVAGVTLREDSHALNEWRTPEGGGCLATGEGGPLTGHGVGLLLVDDPHKNRQEAESEVVRDRIHGWFTSTALTRLEPNASVIVVHTRWHPDDLIGRLENDDSVDWEVINLPAIDDQGSALWPERWPIAALEARKRDVGEYDWASMYMGRPRPRGGAVFNDPHSYDDLPRDGVRYSIGVDLAYTAKTSSDYSVAVVLASDGARTYVVDVVRVQEKSPIFARILKGLCAEYRGAPVVGYVSGTEQGAAAFMQDLGIPFEAWTAKADKFVRAQPVAAAWNRGDVLTPRRGDWVDAFALELARFTGVGDAHDDQVDALAAAFDALNTATSGAEAFGERPNFSELAGGRFSEGDSGGYGF